MIKIIYIGSFLSKKVGSKDIIEKIKTDLERDSISIRLFSSFSNRFFRFVEILLAIIFSKERIVIFDVFSGKAFIITWIGSSLALVLNKKIVFILHGGALPDFTVRHMRLVTRVMKRAHYIQTPSQYLKEYFTNLGFSINYVPNPIELDRFPYKQPNTNERNLLWVRAFNHIYNPEIAVNILFEIRKKYPDARLTMIGPDKGELNITLSKIEKLNLGEAIQITGPIANENLSHYYQNHSVYINTTSYESFGLSLLEAASSGIPIVSIAVGEIPYMWTDHENILMLENLDPTAYAKLVYELWENKDLALKLSSNARKKAETFAWELIKPQWIEMLKKVSGKEI